MNNEKVLVKMIFGSHLYGLNTPTSDKDYKGVFVPNLKDLLLCKAPKVYSESTKKGSDSKNSPKDIDSELYSINYFIDLACKGETVALDMLHAPKRSFTETSWQWEDLQSFRSRFYTKNLTALVGYAKHQAAKYGVKGSRLHDAKSVLEIIKSNENKTVLEVWNLFPITDNLQKFYHEDNSPKIYEVCGKKLTLTAKCKTYVPMIENFVRNYGERARLAEANEGVDWKAISHAFRAAYQVRAIFTEGGFTYPLKEVVMLQRIKSGQMHYGKEVGPILDLLLDEVMALREKSTLPKEVDRSFFDEWILNTFYSGVI